MISHKTREEHPRLPSNISDRELLILAEELDHPVVDRLIARYIDAKNCAASSRYLDQNRPRPSFQPPLDKEFHSI